MRAILRLASLSSQIWPGLDPASASASGAGLTLPCASFEPFQPPKARAPEALRVGGKWYRVAGSGRYGPCWLSGAHPGQGVAAEVAIWLIEDGRYVIEPLLAAAQLQGAQSLLLGAHLGPDARGIAAQMAGLHRLQLEARTVIDTPEGPRPAGLLQAGARVGVLGGRPAQVTAVLACRGGLCGAGAPWHVAAEALGNATPLTLPPNALICPPAAPETAPVALKTLAPSPGLSRGARAMAVDWVVLGFEAPQRVAVQGLFLATRPPPSRG